MPRLFCGLLNYFFLSFGNGQLQTVIVVFDVFVDRTLLCGGCFAMGYRLLYLYSFYYSTAAYGHITTVKTWTVSTEQGTEQRYEINISTATLDRPIENTTATLLHEMAHLYNLVHGIRDTSSQSGAYHNKRFKATAEAHGLVIDHHEKYGWTITSPSEELLDFIIFMGWQDIQMTEGLTWADMCGTGTASKGPGSSQTGAPKPPKAKSSTRRWVCPKCGTIIRSTKEVRVICADCMELFVKAD